MEKSSHVGRQNKETKKGILTSPLSETRYALFLRTPALKTYFHLAVIILIAVTAYSNTFNVPFLFDDTGQIKNNRIIRDFDNFLLALKGHNFAADGYIYIPSRFVGYLSFACNFYFGGVDVTGYHVVNLAVHIINGLLVYFLVVLTFGIPSFNWEKIGADREKAKAEGRRSETVSARVRNEGELADVLPVFSNYSRFPSPYSQVIAIFSALLFVSHPLQTQAVTYIVQRFTSLATLFYLLSIVLYIKGRISLMSAVGGFLKLQTSTIKSFIFFFLSLISAVLAMKTKEIAFTLPIMIILYESIFFTAPMKRKLFLLLPAALTLVIVPLSFIHSDKPFGEILSDISEKARVETQMSRWNYLITELRVITTYIRLIFLPINQNLDYDYPIYHSLFTTPVFLSFLFLSALLTAAAYLLYRARSGEKHGALQTEMQGEDLNYMPSAPHYRLIGFGILWFFITLSVESSIIPIIDVIFEHRLYLPSIGFLTAITSGIFIAASKLKKGKGIIPILILITLALTVMTYERNDIWRDGASLWEDVVKKSPNKARPHNNLGEIYYGQGRLGEAMREFQTALLLNPFYATAHNNMGGGYAAQGIFDKAIEEFQIAVRLAPDYVGAHYNLGQAFLLAGLPYDDAIREFNTTLRLNPDDADARRNLELLNKRIPATNAKSASMAKTSR